MLWNCHSEHSRKKHVVYHISTYIWMWNSEATVVIIVVTVVVYLLTTVLDEADYTEQKQLHLIISTQVSNAQVGLWSEAGPTQPTFFSYWEANTCCQNFWFASFHYLFCLFFCLWTFASNLCNLCSRVMGTSG